MVFRILVALAFAIVCTPPAWATSLENPVSGAIKSGVGLISGWVCEAEELEVSFDGGPRKFVPYGSERVDTASVCGDTDNGFGLLWNYSELGDGPHSVTLYVDGVVATRVNFNVKTLGTNFLRGVTGQGTITLSDGKQVNVQWEETTQGFTITGYTGGDTATSEDAHLRKILGTWRMTTYDEDGSSFEDNYVFSDIETIDGVRHAVGTLEGTDVPIIVGPTEQLYPDVSNSSEYPYVSFFNDGTWCWLEVFALTSSTTLTGWSYYARASTECMDTEGPLRLEGVRIQGPQ